MTQSVMNIHFNLETFSLIDVSEKQSRSWDFVSLARIMEISSGSWPIEGNGASPLPGTARLEPPDLSPSKREKIYMFLKYGMYYL